MTPSRRLYLDNAATSFPKPPAVMEAMVRYATQLGASPGRGAYREAIEAGRLVQQCRARLNTLINGQSPAHIIFTLNCTDALNLAIKGLVHHHRRRGEAAHIVTTVMDHNSILRPLSGLGDEATRQTRVECDPQTGLVDPVDIAAAIEPETRLVALIHGSNVTGALQPIADIGAVCRQRGVTLLVDAAQTIGHVPIDVQRMQIDLLAFPGHKSLLGPLGTGGLYIRPGLEQKIDSVREGGTGSVSESDIQPDVLPDKYESGSANAMGIIGLSEGVKWILDRGVDALWSHERQLMQVMLDGLRDAPALRIVGAQTIDDRCGVFSIVIDGIEPTDLAAILETSHGLLTRAGVHCAPLAHRMLGTHDGVRGGGTTRLSFGPFLNADDVRYAATAIQDVCRTMAGSVR
jgi:cysteine desulfurase family protein